MISLRLSDGSVVWALEAARIWLVVLGCAVGGWALGFGMGYRRGATDALIDNLSRLDERVSGD
jgi:hypothetical protein